MIEEVPITESELGKKSDYQTDYNPTLLFPISRTQKRQEIGIITNEPPFFGFDSWTHYEVSWLDKKGKPIVAIAEIIYDCRSAYIIESKSLKLYFNSFNNTKFTDSATVETTIKDDLSKIISSDVQVKLYSLDFYSESIKTRFSGESIDDLDVECKKYNVEPAFLFAHDKIVQEKLYSDLLKSNCLVTYQPDWGSVQIEYKGKQIDREGLLKYLVSFRNHNEFHEQCIERIFMDIMKHCKPEELTVYGRYTRRGGLDINPYRTTKKQYHGHHNIRLIRQ